MQMLFRLVQQLFQMELLRLVCRELSKRWYPTEIIYAYEPNVFSKAETGTEIKAFRGYLELEGVFPKRLNLYIDGEQTGVRLVKGADEDVKVNVYTTDGKLVRSAVKRNAALQGLPSGVYVVDGKKCVK